MAKIDGALVLVKIGGVTFTGQLNGTFNYNVDTFETTTKDSNGHKENAAGEDGGTFSVGALYDPSGTYSFKEVFAAAKAKLPVIVVMGRPVAGSDIITANCIINSVSWAHPKNASSTLDVGFITDGEISISVYSDATAPLLEAAYINAATATILRLKFNEELDPNYKPASSVWTIGGVAKTISDYSFSGVYIYITVTVAFGSGDTVTIAYTNPGSGGIRDKSGNVLATFTAESVTNNV